MLTIIGKCGQYSETQGTFLITPLPWLVYKWWVQEPEEFPFLVTTVVVSEGVTISVSYIDIHHFPQAGDSPVLQATGGHHSDALRELVSAGANPNLPNQVRYTVTVETALQHVSHSWLSILGRSDSSDGLSIEWGDRAHRYSPNWRKHWPRPSWECETPDYITR